MSDKYTILWTDTETGRKGWPIEPIPLPKEQAELWAQGYGRVVGEIVRWSDYLSYMHVYLPNKKTKLKTCYSKSE